MCFIYKEYQQLSPIDEQIVFRDMMKRLYTPVLNNWGILSHKRYTKPDKDYLTAFDLKNREVIDYVGGMEKKAMYILAQGGVFKSFGKYHQKMDTSDFRFNKPIVYSFSFELNKPEIFFELYKLIFKEDSDKTDVNIIKENKPSNKLKKQMVKTREAIEYNPKTGALRVKETEELIFKCRAESVPRLLLEKIFSGIDNTATLKEIGKKIAKSTTVENSIKGSIKPEIKKLLFITDTYSIELRKEFDMEKLMEILSKQSKWNR